MRLGAIETTAQNAQAETAHAELALVRFGSRIDTLVAPPSGADMYALSDLKCVVESCVACLGRLPADLETLQSRVTTLIFESETRTRATTDHLGSRLTQSSIAPPADTNLDALYGQLSALETHVTQLATYFSTSTNTVSSRLSKLRNDLTAQESYTDQLSSLNHVEHDSASRQSPGMIPAPNRIKTLRLTH